ncbi:MAG: hypothetical protein ACP5E2_09180 [Terracidiphilus sp.]
MSFDTALWLAGDIAEAVIIVLFIYRRLWRIFPVFFLYVIQSMMGDVGLAIAIHSDRRGYATWYMVETILDSILLFAVLVELAWSILRPVRASLSRRALIPVSGFILAVGAVVWPFASLSGLAGATGELRYLVQLQQTVSILQSVFFLALVASSQALSIGWRDRELQIASGLGLFSMVNVAAALLRTHQTALIQYKHMNQALIGAWLCTLLYWTVSFMRKEAERREFTPEMQRVLLAVAGAARASRVVLTESQAGRPHRHDQH